MRVLVLMALAVSFCTEMAWAQATAQIHGVVQDSTGGAVPGASIKATQSDTGLVRTTVTEADGNYALTNLPVGPYQVEISKDGFTTAVQSGITLQVGSDPAVSVALKVGAVSERVNVEANATQVETTAVGVGTVIENQRILELPLNGRQPTDLITLSGVAVQTGSSPAYGMRAGVSIAVAGGTSYSVQYNLDGAFHVEIWSGTNLPLPFPDSLQEFRLVTSTQDAASGGHSSASVNGVTKSGTNAFHGDLFEFFRNSALNGRDFFASKSDKLKRNQFGGTFGGPIKKDTLFFFVGYQGTLTRQTPSATAFVPTAKMQAGDFSDYRSRNCGTFNPGVLDANNRLITPLSPAAVKIAALLPKTADPCGFVVYDNAVSENQLQVPVRVDYQLSSKQQLFGRYLATRIDNVVPWEISRNPLSVGVGNDDLAQSLAFGHTYLISPTMVNSFRVFGNRIGSNHATPSWGGPADFGIRNFYSSIPTFVPINIAGSAAIGFGPNFTSGTTGATSFGFNEDVNVIRGSHQFSFGANLTQAILVNNSYAWSEGAFTYVNGPFTGNALANFLTGQTTELHQANPNPQYLHQTYFSAYAGDVWKATKKLTLNYGIRWNPFLPAIFRQSDVSSFSIDNFNAGIRSKTIPTAPVGFTYPGDPGFNGRSSQPKMLNHWEPRFGFAYDPFGDGKTAIRGGAGIAFDFARMDLNINASTNAPFRQTVVVNNVSLDNPYATVPGGNPFPYFYNPKNPVFPSSPLFQSYIVVPPTLQTPQQYSWNFGIQRQITPNFFTSATYIGTHLIHGPNAIELNAGQFIPGNCVAGQYGLTAAGPCTPTNNSNLNFRRRLYLQNPAATQNLLGSLTQTDDGNTQRYNGLLLNATWRKGALNLIGNYTWSHCTGPALMASTVNIGNGNPHEAGQNAGPTDRRLDYGNCISSSTVDVRHIGNVTAVVTTPNRTGGWDRRLTSGWTFSTIYSVRSGQPLALTVGSDRALNGLFTLAGAYPSPQRPNQLLGNVYATSSACATSPCVTYLNAAAFGLPTFGTYGNMGFGSVYGPGFWEWDQTVSRQFRITEGQRLEVRAEAFNLTNSVRFANPGVNAGNAATFGRITAAQSTTGSTSPTGNGGRIVQFALKYVF